MSTPTDIARMLLCLSLSLLLGGFFHSSAYNFGPSPPQNSTELSRLILYICDSYFAQRTSSIAISAEVETKQARYYFNDFQEQMLRSLDRLKVQIDSFGYHNVNSWDFFNILLVDSAKSYRKINPGEKTKNQDYNEYYLVVLKPFKDDDYLGEIEAIFAYCWSYYIVNVSILLEDSTGSVHMFTYFPFTVERCFSTSATKLSGLEFRDIFPSKMANFHKCVLVGALWNVPPYVSLNTHATGLDVFNGVEGHLLRELAGKMNFSLSYITPPNDQQRGLVYKNGSVTGAIKLLQEKTAHLSLGCFRCTKERSTVLTPSHSFYQTMQVYTVKAGTEPWTAFEIITYPFDFYIWTLMLLIMIAAIVISFGLEKYNPDALYFIFGFRNSAAVINVIAAWLGSPVVPEPRRNFARFLLTLWLFVALVLRNSYQGLLFDFLRSNLGHLPPDTAQDLAQRHYSLIVNLASNDTFSGVPIIRDGHLNILVKNITDAGGYPLLEATNENLATATPKDFLSYYVLTTKKYGVFHVLKERIFAQQMCIYFSKHSFLMAPFNEVLMNVRSFGLIDLWTSQYIDDSFIELRDSGPTSGVPIAMNQLEGLFQISIICLLVAVMVFTVEVMSLKISVLRRLMQ